jgi:hypothetical protein
MTFSMTCLMPIKQVLFNPTCVGFLFANKFLTQNKLS